MTFRGDRLAGIALPTAAVWFIDEIAEAKGRQVLYTRQAPQVLKALRDMALVQSAESSGSVSGVREPGRCHSKPARREACPGAGGHRFFRWPFHPSRS